MDRERFSFIGHTGLRYWNPVPAAVLDDLPARLGLNEGGRVLDVGCGRGAFLLAVVAATGAHGTGVDASETAVAAAKADAWEQGLEDRVDLVVARWDEFDPGDEPFDLVACIGSSHAFGGCPQALAAIHAVLRPGGQAVLGEGYWQRTPDPEYVAFLGGSEDDLLPHGGNADRAVAAGFEVVETHHASGTDWDAYEDTYAGNIRAFLAAHPDDPEAEAMRARIDGWREQWERHGRGTLGFELLRLRKPVGGA